MCPHLVPGRLQCPRVRYPTWIMRKMKVITALWINTETVMTRYVLIERRPGLWRAEKMVQHMVWCHHTEPWSVCCAVVSVWLICNKTWHFKSPTCATSDNKPLLRSLWELVDSAAPDDGFFFCFVFLSHPCVAVWYHFDLVDFSFFSHLCSPSTLIVLPLSSDPL